MRSVAGMLVVVLALLYSMILGSQAVGQKLTSNAECSMRDLFGSRMDPGMVLEACNQTLRGSLSTENRIYFQEVRGSANTLLGNYDDAYEDLRPVIENGSYLSTPGINLLLTSLGLWPELVAYETRWVDAGRSAGDAVHDRLFSRGFAYFELGDFENAEDDYREAAADYRNAVAISNLPPEEYSARSRAFDPEIQRVLSVSLFYHGEPDCQAGLFGSDFDSREEYYAGIQSMLDYCKDIYTEVLSLTLNNLCMTEAVVGDDLDDAIEHCREAIALKSSEPGFRDSLGFALMKAGEFDEAIREYDAAISADPQNAHAIFGRGVARAGDGDGTSAREDFDLALSIDPEIASTYAGYGIDPQ